MANQWLNLAVVFRGKLIPVYICHTVIVASKLTTTYWEWRPRGGLNFSNAHKHADVEIAQEFTWKEETMRNQYAAGGIECLQMTREHKRTLSSCVQCKTSHVWGSLQCYWVFIFILEIEKKGNQNSAFLLSQSSWQQHGTHKINFSSWKCSRLNKCFWHWAEKSWWQSVLYEHLLSQRLIQTAVAPAILTNHYSSQGLCIFPWDVKWKKQNKNKKKTLCIV